ncbi:hypothetical protein VPNG_02824 [Cytospora leucostoma]|uniref:Peptidase S8/S53 domain-containing protein n=1 Tax=Cytospora leucostoma TaxID=1230097 RepID=A0A423XJ40_9PEZI|nr:hypothetical protein VPNG_02824 [Cytospora leucostoma]
MCTSKDAERRVESQTRLISNVTLGIASVIGCQRQNLVTFGECAAAGLQRARLTRAALELDMDMQELPDSNHGTLTFVEDAYDNVLVSFEDGVSEDILGDVGGGFDQSPALLDQDLQEGQLDKETLPKLHALARLRQSTGKQTADFREEDNAIGRQLAPYIDVDYFLDEENNMKKHWEGFESTVNAGLDHAIDQADLEIDNQDADILTKEEIVKLGIGTPNITLELCNASVILIPSADTDGHGTYTASLLMRVAPHADLYIAKIASTAHRGFEGLQSVVNAIRWAAEKQVDIITMSFGFADRTNELQQFANEIERAHKADIISFSAASNIGGNGERAYPAREPSVMCIHAVDGLGNNCGGFNPSAVENEENFATLGIGISCVWDEERCSRSGTSYATPIAAGFAANALEYATYHKNEDNLDLTTHTRLRKPSGMRRMFMLMADERDKGSGYLWVRPWKFWSEDATDSEICARLEREFRF